MATTTLVSETQADGGSDGGEARLGIAWLFPFTETRFVPFAASQLVGRDPTCDVVLEGAELSRRHAFIVSQGGRTTLRDLGSTNGVFVDGVRMTGELDLREGHVVRLGDVVGVCTRARPDATLFDEHRSGLLIGPTLARAMRPLLQVARTDLPIVLVGETGTGKEMVARALHEESGRSPFHAVNCSALPENLVEAELFGYRKGAFTGAANDTLGHLRAASGGTLLLDELLDLPFATQPKLLRALEQQEVIPLGGTSSIAIDVRIVCATQEPLAALVARGQFRADLQARLEGAVVTLPPLRERREEIPFLFTRLYARVAGGGTPRLSPRFVERLCLHDWPLNVRELGFFARRLHAFHGQEPMLRTRHFESAQPVSAAGKSSAATPPPVLDELPRDAQLAELVKAVRATGGNVAQAAARLGISRPKAYRLLEGTNLDDLRGKGP